MQAEGYDLVICGSQRRQVTRSQLQAALEAGMKLEAYVWLGWQGDTADQVRRALETVEGFPVRRLWLDVEEPDGGLTAELILNAIQRALDACGTMLAGIYTSRSKWQILAGNSPRFGDLPLWAAFYTDDDDIDNWGGPFGGWDRCQMRQHAGDAELAGVHVDLNRYRETA